jgi:hypothetical protein
VLEQGHALLLSFGEGGHVGGVARGEGDQGVEVHAEDVAGLRQS